MGHLSAILAKGAGAYSGRILTRAWAFIQGNMVNYIKQAVRTIYKFQFFVQSHLDVSISSLNIKML